MRIPAGNLIGEEGRGLEYLVAQLPQERLLVAIAAAAAAEAALDWTIDYVTQRKAFGMPLATMQNTLFEVAEMATEAKIGRVFVDGAWNAMRPASSTAKPPRWQSSGSRRCKGG